jgi:ubiquinone/menaquinone biosynthesis C-methylase UbiE
MQKKIFLETEGNAYFDRNETVSIHDFLNDPIVNAVSFCIQRDFVFPKCLLEVGCGQGARLHWISRQLDLECHGIDPSLKAIEAAQAKGVRAVRGTADLLPFEDCSFDILVFGFCLYVCDPEDLFKIACEANRVLKSEGWLIIRDFYSRDSNFVPYSHDARVRSHKMNYRTLFDWHPFFNCLHHEIVNHGDMDGCDDQNEWIATSILRKRKI